MDGISKPMIITVVVGSTVSLGQKIYTLNHNISVNCGCPYLLQEWGRRIDIISIYCTSSLFRNPIGVRHCGSEKIWKQKQINKEWALTWICRVLVSYTTCKDKDTALTAYTNNTPNKVITPSHRRVEGIKKYVEGEVKLIIKKKNRVSGVYGQSKLNFQTRKNPAKLMKTVNCQVQT